MEYILNEIVDTSANEVEQVLAVYNYLAKSTYTEITDDRTQSDIIVSGKGICTDYAYGMRSVLVQLGDAK